MKRLNKVLLSTAGSLLAIGLVLALVGWAMGGQTSMEVDVGGYRATVGMTGFHAGVNMSRSDATTVTDDELTAFDKLDVDISLGDVSVIPSDHFGVDIFYYGKNYELHYENNNGTLKVWSTSMPTIGINFGMNYDATVTVYIPEGAQLKDATIKTAMGDIDMQDFAVDTLDIRANMGSVTVGNADVINGTLKLDMGDLSLNGIAADKLDMTLSMGDVEAYGVTTEKELTVVNHMGKIVLEGTLRGRVEATDNMGDISITTDLPESDYGYDLKTSMGSVEVDGNDHDDKASRSGGTHTITADNSMGDIEIYFG